MNDNKDTYKNKNEFFKTIINQFMVNKMEDLSYDKMMIERRIDFHQFDIDTYYDMLVNHVRMDYARNIFRQISELIDIYL